MVWLLPIKIGVVAAASTAALWFYKQAQRDHEQAEEPTPAGQAGEGWPSSVDDLQPDVSKHCVQFHTRMLHAMQMMSPTCTVDCSDGSSVGKRGRLHRLAGEQSAMPGAARARLVQRICHFFLSLCATGNTTRAPCHEFFSRARCTEGEECELDARTDVVPKV